VSVAICLHIPVGKQSRISGVEQSRRSVPICCFVRVGLLLGGLASVACVRSGSRQALRSWRTFVGGVLSVVRTGEWVIEGMN